MKIHLQGDFSKGWVWIDGKPLPPAASLKLINHSPTGFSWGYHGSGPAQLALAILLEKSGDSILALAGYQELKREIIAGLPQQDLDLEIDISRWVDPQKAHAWVKAGAPGEPELLRCSLCGVWHDPGFRAYFLGPDPEALERITGGAPICSGPVLP